MTRFRITIALLAATSLIAAVAAPAAAKGKPPKPEDLPLLMDVTMSGALATTCEDGDGIPGKMVMELDDHNRLSPVHLGLLSLDIPDVDSTRRFDAEGNLLGHYDTDGTFIPDDPSTGFTGCHGEQLDGSASPYGGLVITVDDTGAVVNLLWHFDYYLAMTERGKSGKPVVSVMEHFTLSGPEWNAETSTASFNVLYHLEDSVNGVFFDYDERAAVPLAFTLTMTPHS